MTTTNSTPKTSSSLANHTHDCDCCEFVGMFASKDVYICGKSVVIRHSSEPSDYSSLPMHFVPVASQSDVMWSVASTLVSFHQSEGK